MVSHRFVQLVKVTGVEGKGGKDRKKGWVGSVQNKKRARTWS